ncbi:MAG TPA: TetR/AcrR family transcriptional regulator [Solirubrobacterales bacterium]|nr:TetR/AcrR family transcriptional regulator [Solirubrobacterales bacterium]
MPTDPAESNDAGGRPAATGAGDPRERLCEAALEVAGEVGYAALSVQVILDRSGIDRSTFDALFAGKEDCFTAAYWEASAELEQLLLAPCREAPDWLTGLAASLEALARLLAARPAWARGVLAEVQVAGGATGARRQEVFERLSRAIDRARREIPRSRHSPPPTTAPFILAAIESAALRSLRGSGPDFAVAMPDLIHLAAIPYLGAEAAEEAARRARRR